MTAVNSPDLYFVAIAPREIELIEEAFPAVPNSCNLLLTTSFIAVSYTHLTLPTKA